MIVFSAFFFNEAFQDFKELNLKVDNREFMSREVNNQSNSKSQAKGNKKYVLLLKM